MIEQLQMGTYDLDGPGRSHHDDPPTSFDAAQGVTRGTRLRILRAFATADRTDDEAGYVSAVGGYSQRRRCSELRKLGYIEPTGGTRKTDGGRPGMVSRITEKGRLALIDPPSKEER